MTNRTISYVVTASDNGIKCENFLKSKGLSSKIITKLKEKPTGITLNNEHIYVSKILCEGDEVVLSLDSESSSENIVATKLDFEIVYEDEDILVINKPANMAVHPSQGNFENTLANAVAYYFQSQNEPFIFRAINRLDKDTTGLLVLAKNAFSACFLSDSMVKREIHREYLALVAGDIDSEGTINAPIARVADSTIERCVNFEHGDEAITHYKKLNYENNISLVSIKLDTGRTHQIRVHFKYIGHPLLGDFLYNPDFTRINRQSLHSYKLTFPHPITKEIISFTAEIPKDMEFAKKRLVSP